MDMKKQRKSMRDKGKVKLSKMFQKLEIGDRVCLGRDLTTKSKPAFPRRMEGRTGVIESKRGKAYVIKANDLNAKKTFIVKPIHLKKLK